MLKEWPKAERISFWVQCLAYLITAISIIVVQVKQRTINAVELANVSNEVFEYTIDTETTTATEVSTTTIVTKASTVTTKRTAIITSNTSIETTSFSETTSTYIETTTTEENAEEIPFDWYGEKLTKSAGVVQGPSGRESYYNLDMTGVVSLMRSLGYDSENYPYWEREDGVKMFGNYVMVAANLDTRPKGTILESSLGWAIVCDTGGFTEIYPDGLDIAVNW